MVEENAVTRLLEKVPNQHRWHVNDIWQPDMERGATCYTKPNSINNQRINLNAIVNHVLPHLKGNLSNYPKAVDKGIESCGIHQSALRENIRDASISHAKSLLYHGEIDKSVLNSLKEIKIRRTRDPHTPVIREADFKKILEIIEADDRREQASKDLDEIIVRFMFGTGCRVSEVVKLNIEDIDLEERTISIIWSKGGKSRQISIIKDLFPYLQDYINNKRPSSDNKNVFLLPGGGVLTRDRVEKRIKNLTDKAGLEGGCHQFRRGFASYYAARNIPVTDIQLVLGHASIQTTMHYIKQDHQAVLNAMRNVW